MSVIACRVKKTEIEWAADSIIVTGWTKIETSVRHAKLARISEDLIIGSSGTCEESELLMWWARNHLPGSVSAEGITGWLLEFAGWKRSQTEKFALDNSFLIGWKGAAYRVHGFGALAVKDYASIGAGEDFALAILSRGGSASEAVETAIACSPLCAGPALAFTTRRQG
jgi:hypothetical protein